MGGPLRAQRTARPVRDHDLVGGMD